jgi:hypothetical protein
VWSIDTPFGPTRQIRTRVLYREWALGCLCGWLGVEQLPAWHQMRPANRETCGHSMGILDDSRVPTAPDRDECGHVETSCLCQFFFREVVVAIQAECALGHCKRWMDVGTCTVGSICRHGADVVVRWLERWRWRRGWG